MFITIARIRLLEVPLERDEGEYAYMGQLIRDGIAPYGIAANMKLPGVSAVYALLFSIFGETTGAIHIGLLTVNLATGAVLFLLAKRLLNVEAGFVAAAAWVVLSSGSNVLGFWAHATHFVVLPSLLALLLLLKWNESRQWLTLTGAGVFFGVAFLMKQHGILFALFGAASVVAWSRGNKVRNLAAFGAAVAAPFAVTCAILWKAGVFENFWFWTVEYASQYATGTPLADGLQNFKEGIRNATIMNRAIWFIALAGSAQLAWGWRRTTSTSWFIFGLLLVSTAAMSPGGYFREHYFILLLPAIALCAAAATTIRPRWSPWVVGIALLFSIFEQRRVLFSMQPTEVATTVYGENPFVAAIEVGRYLKEHSWGSARILILGSEPEILFYSRRRGATPYLYMYPMMEDQPFAQRMQTEFIKTAEQAAPDFVVVVNVGSSWLRDEKSPQTIFDWWPHYERAHYQPIGVANILPGLQIVEWDGSARPTTPAHVQILTRRD